MKVDIGGGGAVPGFRVRSDRKSDLNTDKIPLANASWTSCACSRLNTTYAYSIYTCLLICLLLWVHMYRRACGSLHSPVTDSQFSPAGRSQKFGTFFYLQLPVCVPRAVSFDDACACSRALQALPRLREHLTTCGYRYIGVSFTLVCLAKSSVSCTDSHCARVERVPVLPERETACAFE